MADAATQHRILAILDDTSLDSFNRRRNLSLLAHECRDRDDMEAFGEVVASFPLVVTEADSKSGTPGGMVPFRPTVDFREMYSVENRLCVFREKHDPVTYQVSDPDSFARVFLSVLVRRLEHGCYHEAEIVLSGKSDPMVAAYLATVPSASLVAEANGKNAADYRVLRKAWSKDPAMEMLCSSKVPLHMLAERLRSAVVSREPDAVAAFLGQALLKRNEQGVEQFVATMLEGCDPVSLSGAVAALVEPDIRLEALRILRLAAGSPDNLRKAGRLAYRLLSSRSDEEYEGFSFETLTQPVLDLSHYVRADLPDAA